MDGNQCAIEISPRDAAQLRRAVDDALLLDCRTPEEFELARLPGSMLLPMQELSGRVGEIEHARDRHVLVICHTGRRSLTVARWLREQGFHGAQSIAGGIDRWSLEIDPRVPRY